VRIVRGHIHKRGTGWGWVVDTGRDPATGKRRQKTRSGFRTRAIAERSMREFIASVESGAFVSESQLTLSEYLEGWLVTAKAGLRPTSFGGYSRDVANICTKLGAVRLSKLTPLQIERAYADLMVDGGVSGRPLSAKTVGNIHAVLRRALGDAERLGVVTRNVARMARPPASRRPETVTWTADQLGEFLRFVDGDRMRAAFYLLATTGMRRGEVFGLRWSDVDLDGGWLSVEQTITTVDDRLIIGPVKTAKSRRRIALDPATVSALRRHRVLQAEERLAAGELWVEGDLVVRSEDGHPMHPDRFTRTFKRRVAASGLPELRGPHSLRHTWATLALEAGVHPKVVSERLGHATIAITLDTYSHVVPSLDADAANMVAARILGEPGAAQTGGASGLA